MKTAAAPGVVTLSISIEVAVPNTPEHRAQVAEFVAANPGHPWARALEAATGAAAILRLPLTCQPLEDAVLQALAAAGSGNPVAGMVRKALAS